MKSEYMSFLKKIDLFGHSYNLTFNKQKILNSTFGGALTILTLCTIFIVSFFLGSEMIYKENPNSISTVLTSVTRPNLTFNISIAYIVEDDLGNSIDDFSQYFSVTPYFQNMTMVSDSTGATHLKYINTSINSFICTEKDFNPENKDAFYNNDLDSAVCFDDGQPLGGFFDNNYASYLDIYLTKCVNSTMNNNTCRTQKEIDQWFKDNPKIQFAAYYETVNYNSKNLHHPNNYALKVESILLDFNFCKIKNFFFLETKISTDYGIIGNSLHNISYQVFDHMTSEFYSHSDPTDKCLANLRLFTSNNSQYYSRTYMKFQDLIARLGVVFNLIIQFFGAFVGFIYPRKMNETIMNKVFDISINDLNSNTDEDEEKKTVKKITDVINIEMNSENQMRDIIDLNNMILKTSSDNSKIIEKLSNRIVLFDEEKKFKHQFYEHFISLFLPCFRREKLKKKNEIFNSIMEYIQEFSDVLTIVNSKIEIEKLKNTLFSKSQLALFNLISLPEIFSKKKLTKKISLYYDYSRNFKQQDQEIIELFERLKCKDYILSAMDKKLIELIE